MQLNFQRQGEGFPLIVLHGLFGSLDNWQTVSRKFGESYQVFTVDLRNHGDSPHSDVSTYSAMVDDVREFMLAQNLSRAHLLGHSLGGKTTMHFALRYPELVDKLIVVDMAPKEYPPVHVPIFDALLALNLNSFRERKEIVAALEPTIPSLAMRQFLVKNIACDQNGALHWKMNLSALHENYGGLRQAISTDHTFTGPVLFIKGGRSEHIADGDMTLIHRLFPRTTVKTIATAGHWVQADAPEELVRMAKVFLH